MPFADSAEINKLNLQEKWQEISLEVETWCDAVGYPIDPKIKDAVIALNAIGINTSASCEGHLDHGYPYPWVEFSICTLEIQSLEEKITKIFKEREEKEQLLEVTYPQLSKKEIFDLPEAQDLIILSKSIYDISNQIELIRKELLKDLYFLIDKFYQEQDISYDNMLFIKHGYSNYPRIFSIGGEWQPIRSQKEKEIKLNEYQKEMGKFALFLKKYFFQEITL